MSDSAHVLEVTEQSFSAQVLEQSKQRPVVVDFWAPWCGPCRMLGPVLEKLADADGGAWVLAKVNVDDNPGIAEQFGIQGIPAVKAFKGGEVVDEFVGAQPERSVRTFLDRVCAPAEDAVALAEQLHADGEVEEARAAFGHVLERSPNDPRALLGLARINLDDGMPDAAIETLAEISDDGRRTLGANYGKVAFAARARLAGDASALRKKAAKGDDAAQLGHGWHLAAQENFEGALEQFLAVIARRHREGAGEDARKAMLEMFDVLGSQHPLTSSYRDKLAAQLYR